MKYLVTGGAGFIGSHITRTLLERGDQVRILDNFSSGKRENLTGLDVELIEGDLRDASKVAEAPKQMVCGKPASATGSGFTETLV